MHQMKFQRTVINNIRNGLEKYRWIPKQSNVSNGCVIFFGKLSSINDNDSLGLVGVYATLHCWTTWTICNSVQLFIKSIPSTLTSTQYSNNIWQNFQLISFAQETMTCTLKALHQNQHLLSSICIQSCIAENSMTSSLFEVVQE